MRGVLAGIATVAALGCEEPTECEAIAEILCERAFACGGQQYTVSVGTTIYAGTSNTCENSLRGACEENKLGGAKCRDAAGGANCDASSGTLQAPPECVPGATQPQ